MKLSAYDYVASLPQPPPTWLNPVTLGLTELREIPKEKVRVIDNGRKGLISFFEFAKPADVTAWEAFVLNRSDNKGSYVFSNEQFWLAAAAAFKSNKFKLQIDHELYRWFKNLALPPVPLKSILSDVTTSHKGRLLDLKRASPKSKDALGKFFDIQEYTICPECGPDDVPDRPAVLLDPRRKVQIAYVPDTSHLASAVTTRLKRSHAKPPKRTTNGGGAPAPQGTSPAHVLSRMPHIDVKPPEPLARGASFEVTIFADTSDPRPGEYSDPIIIDAPPDLKEFVLGVWLTGSPHFVITDPGPKSITITRDVARSTEAAFQVVARRDIVDPSTAKLTAIFDYKHRPCGSVSRNIDLGNPPPSLQLGRGAGDPRIEIEPTAQPADLVVTIANPTPDGLTYDCIVSTPHLPKFRDGYPDKWSPGGTTKEVVEQHFTRFTAPGLKDDLRVANLTGAGVELFKAAPKHFKEAFWQLLDGGHPLRSISIVSIEPYMPWELMVPKRARPDGPDEQRKPLGIEFAVGRWISNEYRSSRQRVTLTDSLIFAPAYSLEKGPKPLAHSEKESGMVRSEFPGDTIAPADFTGFEAAMASGGRSLLHFICHGKSAAVGAQTIYSEDGTELSSIAFTGGTSTPPAIAKSKPFVFMNACEVGRLTPNLVGVGGFAPTFIDLGASCVIAPLWSVKDKFAPIVAEEFYRAVKSDPGKPFADILASIRARAYRPEGAEDSYAAYCFYGDPLAAQHN
ncbi:MAG TPA: CHAT domain-containing protein [Chthoniobacterales bacterium]|nr:CHAT domain-containing protein [Chthoniobacterales bacterium]